MGMVKLFCLTRCPLFKYGIFAKLLKLRKTISLIFKMLGLTRNSYHFNYKNRYSTRPGFDICFVMDYKVINGIITFIPFKVYLRWYKQALNIYKNNITFIKNKKDIVGAMDT